MFINFTIHMPTECEYTDAKYRQPKSMNKMLKANTSHVSIEVLIWRHSARTRWHVIFRASASTFGYVTRKYRVMLNQLYSTTTNLPYSLITMTEGGFLLAVNVWAPVACMSGLLSGHDVVSNQCDTRMLVLYWKLPKASWMYC